MRVTFTAEVLYWRGPSPFHFLPLPAAESDDVRAVAGAVSYGWGCIPVRATIGGTTWTTSLMPKDGRYLLPLRAAVRQAEEISPEQSVTAAVLIEPA